VIIPAQQFATGSDFAHPYGMKRTISIALMCLTAACSREQAHQAKEKIRQKTHDAFEAATPYGKDEPGAAQQREKQRFNQQWRALQSFRAQQEAKAVAEAQALQPPPEQRIAFTPAGVAKKNETFKGLDANAINASPVTVPITGDVRGPSVLKAQVYLDRLHFSVGAIDGRWGRNSAITTWWWQRAHGLPATGDVDEPTFRALARAAGYAPPLTTYTITPDDTKGPFVSIPQSPYEKATLKCLCYESLREELAEKFHATEDFLEVLNPGVKFSELQPGTTINVPDVRGPVSGDPHDIARVIISVSGNSWSGFDAAGHLIFHAPTTLGSTYDPSPNETVKVVKIVHDPHFHYDPTLYHDVPDSEPDAMMSPGPNSPVGVVWMQLSKEHYGMHGTPDPDSIGYTSSHGCVRLVNWDAEEVSHRISEGTQVSFVDPTPRGLPNVAKKKD
jgi:lipoprotein-anchoring transpeptidase ErfK/SrfK